MFWLGNCFPIPHSVKTFLTRTLPLILCIIAGTALSWVSIYAFWFAPFFHSVAIVRACDAVGGIFLLPTRWVFEAMGQDQSAIFFDPKSYAGTNGLILGVLFYSVFRAIWRRREEQAARGSAVPRFACTLDMREPERAVSDPPRAK